MTIRTSALALVAGAALAFGSPTLMASGKKADAGLGHDYRTFITGGKIEYG